MCLCCNHEYMLIATQALNLATHFPDLAIGAAPAAGWIKWEHYVPYFTRLGDSYADPYLQVYLGYFYVIFTQTILFRAYCILL